MALLRLPQPKAALLQAALIIICATITANSSTALSQIQFYKPDFSNSTGILSTGTVQFANSAMWMISSNSKNNLIGRVAFDQPMAFTSNSSFNTSFTFQTTVTGQNQTLDCPSGIAFFISPDGATAPYNSGGYYFGLVDPDTINTTTNITTDPFFAVVFDMAKDVARGLNDPSYSYIAIDINSLIPGGAFLDTSDNTSSYYPELYLCQNSTFTVHISYSALSQTTQVWMTNATNSSILNPAPSSDRILTLKRDLFTSVFDRNSTWYVGLSVTNYKVGNPPAHVAFLSWYFSVDHTGSGNGTSPNLKLIIPLSVLGFILAVCGIILVIYLVRRRRVANVRNSNNGDAKVPNIEFKSLANLERYSYQELKDSAHGFDPSISLIGEGGSSKVYKGTLRDGSVVAIKRLKDRLGKENELASELRIINDIRHRNLLQLQGWSYDKGEALLVYKFMSNGSLEPYLFGDRKGTLDGDTRLKILEGVAAALDYLHSGLGQCVLHRDIKAPNVLLTEDFEPALGDFGLARLIKHNEIVTATMVGTPGHVAPEVFITGKVTDKADVYSFGVLMLEVACGRPALNRAPEPKPYTYLVEWVARLHRNDVDLIEVLDPSIFQLSPNATQTEQQWKNFLHLALMCCQPSPNSRPTMRYVNQYIHDLIHDPDKAAPSYISPNLEDDKEYNDYLIYLSTQSPLLNATSVSDSSSSLFGTRGSDSFVANFQSASNSTSSTIPSSSSSTTLVSYSVNLTPNVTSSDPLDERLPNAL